MTTSTLSIPKSSTIPFTCQINDRIRGPLIPTQHDGARADESILPQQLDDRLRGPLFVAQHDGVPVCDSILSQE
jgi:hypothetical protein